MSIKYRPEVDGLRTIAVLAVIIYHAQFIIGGQKLLPGGLFGVDIFFVISGFLITSLITKEIQKNGTVSILNFYDRRARRLLPALLLVILASIPFAWMYLLPDPFIDYANSLIASLSFGSNFYWNFSLQQYGAESGLLKPFLHTWSLAVEEQYYIVFPLVLLAIYRWFKSYLVALLSAGLLLSLIFAEWMTQQNASFSFYMLPSRVWELLMGGLLVQILHIHPQENNKAWLNSSMPTLGLSLIIYSIIFIDYNHARHPGFITLLPVIGTVLIIWFSSKQNLLTKVLSSKLFVGIGLISYALYLWHYPIFAFGRIINPHTSSWGKLVWIAITFILAGASFFAVERPFRRSKTIPNKVFYGGLIAITFMTISFSVSVLLNDGYKERWGYLNVLNMQSKRVWVKKEGERCHFGSGTPILAVDKSCHFKNSLDGQSPIVVIGDSHAGSLADSIKALAKFNSRDFIQVTVAGCSHIAGFKHSGVCGQRSNDLLNYLSQFKEPIVIYNSRLPLYIELEGFHNPEGWIEDNYRPAKPEWLERTKPSRISALTKGLTSIASASHSLTIIYPVPEQGFHVYKRLAAITPSIKSEVDLPDFSTNYETFKDRAKDSYGALNQIESPNVLRVLPEAIFCKESNGRCTVSEGERIYFASDNHVSPLGADLIIREVAAGLGLDTPHSFRE